MTVLLVIAGIIAFFVILLHFSVRAEFAVSSGKPAEIKVKWLFFTLYPAKPHKHRLRSFLAKFRRKKRRKKPVVDILNQPESKVQPKPAPEIPAAETPPPKPKPELDKASDKERKKLRRREKKLEKQIAKERKKKNKAKHSGGKLDELKAKWNKYSLYLRSAGRYTRKLLKTIRFTGVEIKITAGKEDAYESAMLYGKLNAALFNLLAVLAGIFTVRVRQAGVECVFNENKFAYAVRATLKIRPSALIAIGFSVGFRWLMIYLKARWARRKERKIQEKNQKKYKINETELLTNE